MGSAGSCFDNPATEAFFPSLDREVRSSNAFRSRRQAQAVVLDWCYGFYNHDRRHSTIGKASPIAFENTALPDRDVAQGSPPRLRGNHQPPPRRRGPTHAPELHVQRLRLRTLPTALRTLIDLADDTIPNRGPGPTLRD